MAQFVKLNPAELKALHEQNPDLVSYNVEFAEVTGGTFWKEYTPEQIQGKGKFPMIGIKNKDSMMQVYPPINLYDPKSKGAEAYQLLADEVMEKEWN